VTAIAGNGPIIFIAASDQAHAVRVFLRGLPVYTVLTSSAMPAGTVIAIAANALASALDPAPRIDLSTEALLHMVDTNPAQIAIVGTPNQISAPSRSLFQTDTIGLRLRMEVSWGLRNTQGLAWVSNTTW